MVVKIPTALIGFGKMAQGYAKDTAMAHFYPYATHAQVLRDHSAFDWQIVVDPDTSACQSARDEWQVPTVVSGLDDLGEATCGIEVVIMATLPEYRLDILDRFPNVRAVLVEKPLGVDLASSIRFIAECDRRGMLVQVNLWRRADRGLRSLADGELSRLIGNVQAVFGVYGNGLKNNGTHMVDMVRMLFGDVRGVQRISTLKPFHEGPIRGDANPVFALETDRGVSVMLAPLKFSHYRENGLCIWGQKGRLDILNEGLTVQYYERGENRAMSGEYEVSSDNPKPLPSTVGYALFEMYNNLADALDGKDTLWSSGASGLRTTRIVEAIETAPENGVACQV